MPEPVVALLALAAVTVGSLHSIAPDHWVPFAALARAQGWSAGRTARITALCGFGHVTVSVALGLLALFFGVEMLEAFGSRMEAVAGLLLIGFGVVYGILGLRRALAARLGHAHDHGDGRVHTHSHVHAHSHGHHHLSPRVGPHPHALSLGDSAPRSGRRRSHADGDDGRTLTAWTLFLLFCADPCVAVIPILFAAAPLGVAQTIAVVAAYELATIGTMVVLVLPARAAVAGLSFAWLNRYSDATAGAVIFGVGVMVALLGW